MNYNARHRTGALRLNPRWTARSGEGGGGGWPSADGYATDVNAVPAADATFGVYQRLQTSFFSCPGITILAVGRSVDESVAL